MRNNEFWICQYILFTMADAKSEMISKTIYKSYAYGLVSITRIAKLELDPARANFIEKVLPLFEGEELKALTNII